MKTFRGDRTIDGLKVTVDQRPLATHEEIKRFNATGFEWSYEGAGPRQLALAILAEHLGDPAKAIALSEGFMQAAVANFDNEWEMTSADIDEVLASLGR
jgi:hypothetical protein